jgi:signal transduction histidine kinase
VRFRITAIASLAVALVLAVAGVGLVLAQRAMLVAGVEESLLQRAGDIEAILDDNALIPESLGSSEDGFVQIVDASGEVVATSPNLADTGALPVDAPASGIVFTTIEVPSVDADLFRVLTERVETPPGPYLLHVGGSLDDAMESVTILGWSLTMTIPVVVLTLAALVWWLVGRTLAPVEAIRAEVAMIGEEDLGRRVPQPEGDDEISRLAATMNGMLDRLQASVEKRQAFVADASHELRGPLTRMRSTVEVEIAQLGKGEARDALAIVLEEVIALQRMVEDLLFLARSDAGQAPIRTDEIDLDDLVLAGAQRLKASGRVEVDVSAVAATQLRGDRYQMERLVTNLLDNAERHASHQVTIALSETGAGAILTVTDDGPGIPEPEQERVFERFTRLDEARSSAEGGTGLGLAIARDIVMRHGGTISVTLAPGGGARFLVTFPDRFPPPDRGGRARSTDVAVSGSEGAVR